MFPRHHQRHTLSCEMCLRCKCRTPLEGIFFFLHFSANRQHFCILSIMNTLPAISGNLVSGTHILDMRMIMLRCQKPLNRFQGQLLCQGQTSSVPLELNASVYRYAEIIFSLVLSNICNDNDHYHHHYYY